MAGSTATPCINEASPWGVPSERAKTVKKSVNAPVSEAQVEILTVVTPLASRAHTAGSIAVWLAVGGSEPSHFHRKTGPLVYDKDSSHSVHLPKQPPGYGPTQDSGWDAAADTIWEDDAAATAASP